MIKVRWTGAAGIEFVTDQGIFLIDPYLSRISKFKTFFQKVAANSHVLDKYLDTLPSKLSGIVVGHTHLDHALDVPYLAKHSDCKVVGSSSLDSLFNLHGIQDRVSVCKGNELIELGDNISVHMILSVHGKIVFGRFPFPGEIKQTEKLPMKASKYCHGTVFIPKIK
ncbi:MAG: MBL fold metallo-hydrolase, partial [Desulfobacteraceae bacterium]|nr:MBL fold metallo-hydrolase [Desulfobacteraceae bacterium]